MRLHSANEGCVLMPPPCLSQQGTDLQAQAWIAILTNCVVFGFTSDQVMAYAPSLFKTLLIPTVGVHKVRVPFPTWLALLNPARCRRCVGLRFDDAEALGSSYDRCGASSVPPRRLQPKERRPCRSW